MFQLSNRSKQRREGIDPRLIEISDLAITLTVIDFGHPADAGLRTAERQNEMYFDPAIQTKCDGYVNESYHQTGKALDVYAYVDNKASWKLEHLALVACAFLQAASILGYQLEWGGLWPWDAPHFQLLENGKV